MKNALIIVDPQNDFVEGGSLAVEGGREVITSLAQYLENGGFEEFDFIVTTQDWHINPGSHFSENPDFVDSWPPHCVAGTTGSAIVEPLATTLEGNVDLVIHKGQYIAAYSGFEGHVSDGAANHESLSDALRRLGVEKVSIAGIATDYCVRETSLDAAELGFRTTVLSDFVAGINSEKVEKTLEVDFPAAGIKVK